MDDRYPTKVGSSKVKENKAHLSTPKPREWTDRRGEFLRVSGAHPFEFMRRMVCGTPYGPSLFECSLQIGPLSTDGSTSSFKDCRGFHFLGVPCLFKQLPLR